MNDITHWLENNDLGKYAGVLAKNEVDLTALAHLTADDLKEMEIPLGPRRKLLAAIDTLTPSADGNFRRLIEDSALGVAISVPSGVIFANESLYRIIGIQPPQPLTLEFNPYDYLIDEDREILTERRRQRQQGEDVSPTFELRFGNNGSKPVWTENFVQNITWEGQPAVLTWITDITERKRAESKLRESEERLSAVLESSPVGVSIFDEDGKFVYANSRIAEMTGRPKEDLVGFKSGSRFVDPAVADELRARYAADGRVDHFEAEFLGDDGANFWMVLTMMPILYGGIEGRLAWVYDITERKRAELLAKQEQELLDRIFEETPIALGIRDAGSGRMLRVNRANVEFHRQSIEQIMQNRTPDAFATEDGHQKFLDAFAEDGRVVEMELLLRRQGTGEPVWCLVSASPINYRGRDAVLSYGLDISERKRVELRAEQEQELLDRIFEETPFPLGILDAASGRGLRANRANVELHRQSVEESLQTTSRDLFVIEGEHQKFLDALAKDGRVVEMELLLRRLGTGEPVWCLVSASPINYRGIDAVLTSVLDISKRKQVELHAEQETELLDRIFEETPFPLSILEAESGHLLRLNRANSELHRQTIEEIEQNTSQYAFATDDGRQTFLETYARDGRVAEMELLLRRMGTGEHVWCLVSASPINYRGTDAMLSCVLDISRRKDTEATLARQSEILDTTMQAMGQNIIMLDDEFRLRNYNERFARSFNLSKEFLDSRPGIEEFIKVWAEANDITDFDFAQAEAMVRRRDHFTFERHLPDGRVYECRHNPLPGGGCVHTFSNITKRTYADAEIAAKQALLQAALDNMSDGIFMLDADLNYVMFNHRYIELTDVPESLVAAGKPIRDVLSYAADQGFYGPGDKTALVDQRMASYLDSQYLEVELQTHRGRTLALRKSAIDGGGSVAVLSDITERKVAEEKIAAQQETLQAVLDNMAQGVIMYDSEQKVQLFNDRARELMGLTKEQLSIDLPFSALVDILWDRGELSLDDEHINDVSRLDDMWVTETGGSTYFYEYTRNNGVTVEIQRRRISDGGIVATQTDITERKRTEVALRVGEERLKLALQGGDLGSWDIKFETGEFVVNEKWANLLGYSYDEVGDPEDIASKTFHPEDRERVDAYNRQNAAGEIDDYEIEYRVVTKQGETRWQLSKGSTVHRDDAGKPKRIVGTVLDITERKQAEEALQRQTQLVQLLHEAAASANQAQDVDDALRACVDAVCAFNSWPVGHVYQCHDDEPDILVPTDIWHLDEPDRFATFRRVTNETTFKRGIGLPGRVFQSGKPAWIVDVTKDANFPRAKQADDIGVKAGFAVPILVGDKVAAVMEFFTAEATEQDDSLLSVLDNIGNQVGRVIERKRAEQEILEARDVAEAATRSKAAFLAAMSHEIRTPMNGVVGMISLLQETQLESDQRVMMNTVQDSAFALLQIINDILDFSKIEAGKMSLEKIPVSIDRVVEGVAETLLPNVANKNLRLSLIIDPEIPDQVITDQVRLRQILFNLLGNATKFTMTNADREGVVSLRAELLEPIRNNQARIRFSIVDNGIGMSAEMVDKLFTPFTQADQSTTRRFGGTGLGLSISKTLSGLLGGVIEVESEEGSGSSFHLTLTLDVAEQSADSAWQYDLSGVNVAYATNHSDTAEAVERYTHACGARITPIAAKNLVGEIQANTKTDPFDILVLGQLAGDLDREAVIDSLRNNLQISRLCFLILTDDRTKRRGMILPDMVVVESAPVRKSSFMHGIAMAAGRASPTVDGDIQGISAGARIVPGLEEARAAGELILVAEDNVTNQDVIRRQLNILGYACEVADDGAIALAMFKNGGYGLVLTDCHMPNMDGYELTGALRHLELESETRLPIVAITANALQGEAERCLASGMDDYLPKPLEMDKLKAMLAKWLPVDHGAATSKAISEPESGSDEVVPGAEVVVDIKVLTDMFGADMDLIKEILDEFVQPSLDIIADIDAGFTSRDADAIKRAAHKLKSSSRTIGADRLSDLSTELEAAGEAEDWSRIEILYPELAGLAGDVMSFIARL